MTEDQAEKILDHLAKKCGAAKLHVDECGSAWILFCLENRFNCRFTIRKTNDGAMSSELLGKIKQGRNPHLRLLKHILEVAKKEDVFTQMPYINHYYPIASDKFSMNVILKAGTCLEEILVEMDLATGC